MESGRVREVCVRANLAKSKDNTRAWRARKNAPSAQFLLRKVNSGHRFSGKDPVVLCGVFEIATFFLLSEKGVTGVAPGWPVLSLDAFFFRGNKIMPLEPASPQHIPAAPFRQPGKRGALVPNIRRIRKEDRLVQRAGAGVGETCVVFGANLCGFCLFC